MDAFLSVEIKEEESNDGYKDLNEQQFFDHRGLKSEDDGCEEPEHGLDPIHTVYIREGSINGPVCYESSNCEMTQNTAGRHCSFFPEVQPNVDSLYIEKVKSEPMEETCPQETGDTLATSEEENATDVTDNEDHQLMGIESSTCLTSSKRIQRAKVQSRCSEIGNTATRRDSMDNINTICEETYFKCDLCSYTTTNKIYLNRHVKVHTGLKPYNCNLCDFATARKGNLAIHMSKHTEHKPYNCSECEYTTAHKSHLTRHMRTHTGYKPYSCSECDYTTAHKSHLTYHMSTHTGHKPYSCSECDYKTAQKHSLTTHMNTHTGHKPYSCSECEYTTSQKSHLIRHMGKHSRQKSYACSVCDYTSARKRNFARHMRSHPGHKL